MIAEIEPFHAIAISRIAHRLRVEGRSIIHMEFGQPSTGAPGAAIADAHKVLDEDGMGYWESPQLKERIARHYQDSYGVEVDPERILLTCGASPAFVLALSCLFAPGARVALARPGYVAYRNTLKALYLDPVEIACGPAERYQITAAAIETLEPAPDGLILASPANPTGTIIAADEMTAIAEVCRRRGIRVISDEIYHGLSYVGRARSHPPVDVGRRGIAPARFGHRLPLPSTPPHPATFYLPGPLEKKPVMQRLVESGRSVQAETQGRSGALSARA